MSLEWYVLKSKPNKEDALYKQIAFRGIEVFFPQLEVTPTNPRAQKTKPYFPGYMFVQVNLASVGLSTFQWMPYAVGLVGFGGEPSVIQSDIIQSLRKSIEMYRKGKVDGRAQFMHGTPLTINEGPFAGYEAIFDTSLSGTDRIRILLNLVKGRQMALDLPACFVQKKE
ncbi:MAG: transcription termination/antitermination NusG family protein [Anaerolineales bacterium]|nr:transcription termination/antitermination NusG family protein [Anaerolineales bacterium]